MQLRQGRLQVGSIEDDFTSDWMMFRDRNHKLHHLSDCHQEMPIADELLKRDIESVGDFGRRQFGVP